MVHPPLMWFWCHGWAGWGTKIFFRAYLRVAPTSSTLLLGCASSCSLARCTGVKVLRSTRGAFKGRSSAGTDTFTMPPQELSALPTTPSGDNLRLGLLGASTTSPTYFWVASPELSVVLTQCWLATQEDLIIVEGEQIIHRRAYLRIQRLAKS